MSIKFTACLEVGGQEVECEVECDYQPAERQTREYPGCAEGCCLTSVAHEGRELAVSATEQRRLEREALDVVHGRREDDECAAADARSERRLDRGVWSEF